MNTCIGLPYCVYYAVEWWHDAANYSSMAILKHDLCNGTRTYWSRPSVQSHMQKVDRAL